MSETKKQQKEKVSIKQKPDKPDKLKGKYIEVIGRRKSSSARIRLYKKGAGIIFVNGKKLDDYFLADESGVVRQPLKLTGHLRDIDFSILVKGGGKKGQAEAVRHGLARSLVELDEEFKKAIRAKGWMTRDARSKERKKPGLKKARRAPQWSKR